MKKILLLNVAILYLGVLQSYAQNVGISANGSAPSNSAGLDVDFSNKGFLPPRVQDTNSVNGPAEGLLIYDLSAHCMRYRTNVKWSDCMVFNLPIATVGSLTASSANVETLCLTADLTAITRQVSYTGATFGAYSAQTINSTGVTGITAHLAAGTFSLSGSGSLSLTFSGTPSGYGVAGFVLNLGGQSCMIQLEFSPSGNYQWKFDDLSFLKSDWTTTTAPIVYLEHTPNPTTAVSYYFGTDTTAFTGLNLYSASNVLMGNSMLTITGLTPTTNTTYYLKEITNTCGIEVYSPFTDSVMTPSVKGCNNNAYINRYETITGLVGTPTLTWLDRNLGAYGQPTSITDSDPYKSGCYYTFNNLQAHGITSVSQFSVPNPTWSVTTPALVDWTFSNDPCRQTIGSGAGAENWRLPTVTEWTNVSASWLTTNNAFNALKTHLTGYLQSLTVNTNISSNPVLEDYGGSGFIWSSSHDAVTDEASSFSMDLGGTLGITEVFVGIYQFGFPVRCVHD